MCTLYYMLREFDIKNLGLGRFDKIKVDESLRLAMPQGFLLN